MELKKGKIVLWGTGSCEKWFPEPPDIMDEYGELSTSLVRRELMTRKLFKKEYPFEAKKLFKKERLPRKLKKRLEKLSCSRLFGRKRPSKEMLRAVKSARRHWARNRDRSTLATLYQSQPLTFSDCSDQIFGSAASTATNNGTKVIEVNESSWPKEYLQKNSKHYIEKYLTSPTKNENMK